MIRRPLLLAALFALAVVLSGCDTTREKSARAKITTERVKLSDKKTVVRRPSAEVRVERVVLVRGKRRSAVAVRVRSKSSQALSDLPIVIDVRRGGRVVALNGRARRPYFESHIAALAPGRSAWWVLELNRRVPRGKLSARIGAPARQQRDEAVVPPVAVTNLKTGTRQLSGTVTNDTGFPQYAIPLYAVVKRGDQVVAAAAGGGVKFSTGENQSFNLRLVGRARTTDDAQVTAMPAVLKPYR